MATKLLYSFLALVLVQLLLLTALLLFASSPRVHYSHKRILARRFLLSDYCLSTESRHTRHRLLSDPVAPFQDLPAYHDHFPSSSFFYPGKLGKSGKSSGAKFSGSSR